MPPLEHTDTDTQTQTQTQTQTDLESRNKVVERNSIKHGKGLGPPKLIHQCQKPHLFAFFFEMFLDVFQQHQGCEGINSYKFTF